jgi:hypothetical protein
MERVNAWRPALSATCLSSSHVPLQRGARRSRAARSRGHVAALGRERVADLLLERRDLACTISPPDCHQGPACM